MNPLRNILTLVMSTLVLFAPARANDLLAVLKLDDLNAADDDDKVPDRWARLIQYVESERIKTSIGIINNSLEGDKPAYLAEIKRLRNTGLFEFWHHGYDHRRWDEDGKTVCEFKGTPLEHQRDHFQRAADLAKKKLGITYQTFGAPFNATDGNTVAVLSEQPAIRVWLQGDAKQTAGKFVIRMDDTLNIEHPVHHPDFTTFVKDYEAQRDKAPRCYVLQGHPNSWDEAAFAEFVRIIVFLQQQKRRFVLPAELPTLLR